MKLIDISRPVFSNMTVWPGDEGVIVECTNSISNGSKSNVSRICAGVHSGTHVDAPLHFIDGGKSIEELDIELFSGSVQVVDVGNVSCINSEMLSDLSIKNGEAVFFKTWYSDLTLSEPFDKSYAGLSFDAAKQLVNMGMKVIGIDTLSVEKFDDNDFLVHKTLLGNEVLIIEGLSLKRITPGKYGYICMPICIKGSDGAPARVVLYNK